MQLKRKVFINKRTGQASVVLPKKVILKLYRKLPKVVTFDIKSKKVKW